MKSNVDESGSEYTTTALLKRSLVGTEDFADFFCLLPGHYSTDRHVADRDRGPQAGCFLTESQSFVMKAVVPR